MMRRSSTSVTGNYARDDINNGGGGTNRRGHLVGTPSRRYRTVALPCLYSIREVNQKLGSLDLDIGVRDSSRDDTPDNPVVVNARLSPSLEATTTDLQQLPLVRLSGKLVQISVTFRSLKGMKATKKKMKWKKFSTQPLMGLG